MYSVGLLSLTGPAMMFYLLRFVSGVPPLEEAMLARRGAAFADYQARVSAFFPRPPRRSAMIGSGT
jgi:steroid 5-alpha reductase family enzyme